MHNKRLTWWEEQIIKEKEEQGQKIWEEWNKDVKERLIITNLIDKEIEIHKNKIQNLKQNREKIRILKKTLEKIEEDINKETAKIIDLEEIKNDSTLRKFIMGGLATGDTSWKKTLGIESTPGT